MAGWSRGPGACGYGALLVALASIRLRPSADGRAVRWRGPVRRAMVLAMSDAILESDGLAHYRRLFGAVDRHRGLDRASLPTPARY